MSNNLINDSTIQVEQGRFSYLDIFLVDSSGSEPSDGLPSMVVTDDTTDVAVRYKKHGDLSTTIKTLNNITTTTTLDVAASATVLSLSDSSSFPPKGRVSLELPDANKISGALTVATASASTTIQMSAEDIANFPTSGIVIISEGASTSSEIAYKSKGATYLSVINTVGHHSTVNVFTSAATVKLKEATDIPYSSNNVSLNAITLESALFAAHPTGTIVRRVDLVEFRDLDGYYTVLFTPEELSNIGDFLYIISDASGTDFDIFVRTITIIPAKGVDTEEAPTLSTCTIKDHILNLDGTPAQNKSVSARLLALPSVIGSAGIVDGVISAKTDANGFFQLPAPQGATLDVVIPSIGYRRTIVVPASTLANLFEIV